MAKILIVEDSEMIRDILARRLSREGYQVIQAVNGIQGVEMAKSEQPSLILMDMSLPVMDGWETTRQIKATVGIKAIPIIALTAHAMTTDRNKCLEAGCDDYETKPINFPQLLAKIQTLVTQGG